MPTVIDQKYLFFDSYSSFYINTNPSMFKVCLDPSSFAISDPNIYYKYWINQCSMHNDMWDINPSNNSFNYNGTTYGLPQGKPTITEIITYLDSIGIVCSYDTDTNHLVFTTNTPYTLDFTVPNSCAYVLGFIQGQTYTITNESTPPNEVTLGKRDVIDIRSDNTTMSYSVVQGETQETNVMVRFTNLANNYELLCWEDSDGEYSVVERTRKDIQYILFYLTDNMGNSLTVNSEWYCSLCIQYIIDYEPMILQSINTLNETMQQLLQMEKRKMIMEDLMKKKKSKK